MHKLQQTAEGRDIFSMVSDFLPATELDTLAELDTSAPSFRIGARSPHTKQSISRCVECDMGRWQDWEGRPKKPTACKHISSTFCHHALFVPLTDFLTRIFEFSNNTQFDLVVMINGMPLVLPPSGNSWMDGWRGNGPRIPSPYLKTPVTLARRIAEHELDNARLHEPLLQIRMGFLVRAHPPNVAHPGTTRDDWPPPSLADQELLKETTEALHKEVRDYFRVQKPAFHANVAPPVYKFFANWLSPPHSVCDFCVSLWDPEVMTARVQKFNNEQAMFPQRRTAIEGSRDCRRSFNPSSRHALRSYVENTTFERQQHDDKEWEWEEWE